MADTKEYIPLRIERMPKGGFIVTEALTTEGGRYCPALFASTSIGEALSFIADRLEPEKVVNGLPTAGSALGCERQQYNYGTARTGRSDR